MSDSAPDSTASLKNSFSQAAFANTNPNTLYTREGATLFLYMIRQDLLEAPQVAELAARGALINKQDNTGDSPLAAAVRNRNLPAIKALVAAGADVEKYEAGTGRSLLGILRESPTNIIFTQAELDTNEEAIAAFLLQQGANPDSTDSDRTPLLVRYAALESFEIVKNMLAAGADPNKRGQGNNYSALYYATQRNNLKLMELLLAAGAEPDIDVQAGRNPSSPLIAAIKNGSKEAVNLLLRHGADPTLSCADFTETPLLAAIARKDTALIDLLVAHKPDILNLYPSTGWETPLYHAIYARSPIEIIAHLIQSGADTNLQNGGSSYRPLHAAAITGSSEILDLLLRHNADPLAKETSSGKTPYQLSLWLHGADYYVTARLKLAEDAALQRLEVSQKKTIDGPARHP